MFHESGGVRGQLYVLIGPKRKIRPTQDRSLHLFDPMNSLAFVIEVPSEGLSRQIAYEANRSP